MVDAVSDTCSQRWQVYCGACGSSSGSAKTREEAIALWNTRCHEDEPLLVYHTLEAAYRRMRALDALVARIVTKFPKSKALQAMLKEETPAENGFIHRFSRKYIESKLGRLPTPP